MVLLAVSPMGQVVDEQMEGQYHEKETIKLNAKSHVHFMQKIFKFYKQDFERCFVTLIGDKCHKNLKVATLLSNPYIGCLSQKLKLEINFMV